MQTRAESQSAAFFKNASEDHRHQPTSFQIPYLSRSSGPRFPCEIIPRLLPQRTHWWWHRRRVVGGRLLRARLAERGALGGGSADSGALKPREPYHDHQGTRQAHQSRPVCHRSTGRRQQGRINAGIGRRHDRCPQARGVSRTSTRRRSRHQARAALADSEPAGWRQHRGHDAGDGLAAAQRARISGRHGEEEDGARTDVVQG